MLRAFGPVVLRRDVAPMLCSDEDALPAEDPCCLQSSFRQTVRSAGRMLRLTAVLPPDPHMSADITEDEEDKVMARDAGVVEALVYVLKQEELKMIPSVVEQVRFWLQR